MNATRSENSEGMKIELEKNFETTSSKGPDPFAPSEKDIPFRTDSFRGVQPKNLPYKSSNIFKHSLYKRMSNPLNFGTVSPLSQTIERIKKNQGSQGIFQPAQIFISDQSQKEKRQSLDANAFKMDYNTLIIDDNDNSSKKKMPDSRFKGTSNLFTAHDISMSTDTIKHDRSINNNSIIYEDELLVKKIGESRMNHLQKVFTTNGSPAYSQFLHQQVEMNVKNFLIDNDKSKGAKYGLNREYLRNTGGKNALPKMQSTFEKKPSQATLKKMSMDMHDYAPVLDKTQTKFNINHQSSRTLEILDNSHPAIVGEQNLNNAISVETFD